MVSLLMNVMAARRRQGQTSSQQMLPRARQTKEQRSIEVGEVLGEHLCVESQSTQLVCQTCQRSDVDIAT